MDPTRVERAFRTLKGIDLQIRPVHHWLAPGVRAHVFLCMLAYDVEWHLREASAPLLFHGHDAAGAEAERISPVQAAAVSPATQRKRATHRTEAGLPVVDYGGLMQHLATLSVNIIVVPKAPDAAFTMFAKPTPLQAAALERLGATSTVSRNPPS